MKYNKSIIMKAAWMYAEKLAVQNNAGKASDYISFTMKLAWKGYKKDAERLTNIVEKLERKEATKKAYENSIAMPEWFVRNKRQEGIEADKFNYHNIIVRQTEKAVLISNNIEDMHHPECQMWVPKSIILNKEVLSA